MPFILFVFFICHLILFPGDPAGIISLFPYFQAILLWILSFILLYCWFSLYSFPSLPSSASRILKKPVCVQRIKSAFLANVNLGPCFSGPGHFQRDLCVEHKATSREACLCASAQEIGARSRKGAGVVRPVALVGFGRRVCDGGWRSP